VTVERLTRDEWEAEASGCDECVEPLTINGKPCWRHRMLYMQLSGTSGVGGRSHTHRLGEQKLRRSDPMNSWEKGIARDDRGVRILSSDGKPIRMKNYSENRHHIDAEVKRMRSPS
jgi:hypothetical protein